MRADAVFVFDGCNSGKKVVARRGFELKDLQSAEEEGILQVSAENLLDDIRVLKVDGGKSGGGKADCDAVQPSWVQLGLLVWLSSVQPESLSRFAALPCQRRD
jgi:hypothetical protein